MSRIDIYKDFSNTPGGRYKEEGDFSGEYFRDDFLWPQLQSSKRLNEKLIINFDNCFGFATSFLEEAFGGIVRKYKEKNLLDYIEIISQDDETIPDLITKYVIAAERELH